jgi:hypothetical protein
VVFQPCQHIILKQNPFVNTFLKVF